jgi:hypothetical protein
LHILVPHLWCHAGDDNLAYVAFEVLTSIFGTVARDGLKTSLLGNCVKKCQQPACSVGSWAELEEKFHSHFYTGVYETRLSHLASVRQGRDESILDFVKRFREIKN